MGRRDDRNRRHLARAAGDELLVRSWTGTLAVRADAGGELQRVIEGMVVPFGQVVTVRDTADGPAYQETMARSALDGVDWGRVNLDYLTDPPGSHNTHQGSRLIGRAIGGESRDDGAWGSFRVSRTVAGDEGLELARDGVLADFSVSFRPVSQRVRADGVIERTAIDLRRVTIVERGAYAAPITAVRAGTEGLGMHCQHCGAKLVQGATHVCSAGRADAAPAAGATAAAAPAQGAQAAAQGDDDQAGQGASSGPDGSRPNRTRVTVDVERGTWDQFTSWQRAQAEGDAVAQLGRNAGAAGGGTGLRGAYVTREAAIYGPGSERSFFGDLWRASAASGVRDSAAAERVDRHYRMLFDIDKQLQRMVGIDQRLVERAGDVLSSEIPGAYPSQYLPGLIVNRVLKERPMAGFYQRVPISDGLPRIYPVVSTSTTVAVQASEGANPAASDFATTGTTVTPLFYGGETSVSRQVLDGADPSTDQMLSTDLNEAYSQASETVVKTAVEAGSTASGVVLTAATPDAGLRGLVMNHLGNVFLPAERLFVPTTLASSWVLQNDTTGRPLAPAYNPMNASGIIDANQLPIIGQVLSVPVAQSWASTAGAGAGVGGVAVIGRSSDFAIFESNVADFRFEQGAGAPAAIRIGLWAYLVVGVRRGSRKATGA